MDMLLIQIAAWNSQDTHIVDWSEPKTFAGAFIHLKFIS